MQRIVALLSGHEGCRLATRQIVTLASAGKQSLVRGHQKHELSGIGRNTIRIVPGNIQKHLAVFLSRPADFPLISAAPCLIQHDTPFTSDRQFQLGEALCCSIPLDAESIGYASPGVDLVPVRVEIAVDDACRDTTDPCSFRCFNIISDIVAGNPAEDILASRPA